MTQIEDARELRLARESAIMFALRTTKAGEEASDILSRAEMYYDYMSGPKPFQVAD